MNNLAASAADSIGFALSDLQQMHRETADVNPALAKEIMIVFSKTIELEQEMAQLYTAVMAHKGK